MNCAVNLGTYPPHTPVTITPTGPTGKFSEEDQVTIVRFIRRESLGRAISKGANAVRFYTDEDVPQPWLEQKLALLPSTT